MLSCYCFSLSNSPISVSSPHFDFRQNSCCIFSLSSSSRSVALCWHASKTIVQFSVSICNLPFQHCLVFNLFRWPPGAERFSNFESCQNYQCELPLDGAVQRQQNQWCDDVLENAKMCAKTARPIRGLMMGMCFTLVPHNCLPLKWMHIRNLVCDVHIKNKSCREKLAKVVRYVKWINVRTAFPQWFGKCGNCSHWNFKASNREPTVNPD